MIADNHDKLVSAVFITFSGNCKKALTFYQTCFGGELQFEVLEQQVNGFIEMPVVSGSLVSERIIVYGSDLVHDEGRQPGNYISIFLQCKNIYDRKELIKKLNGNSGHFEEQRLIEIIDSFEVRWMFGI